MAEQQHHAKAELIADLDRARAKISRNFEAFRHDIDVPSHVKSSVREHKAWWITGAASIGLLLAKLPARKKKIYVDKRTNAKVKKAEKAGLALGLAKLAFGAAKPAITAFATKKIAEIATRQSRAERHPYS
jgi:microcystin-dependent protein